MGYMSGLSGQGTPDREPDIRGALSRRESPRLSGLSGAPSFVRGLAPAKDANCPALGFSAQGRTGASADMTYGKEPMAGNLEHDTRARLRERLIGSRICRARPHAPRFRRGVASQEARHATCLRDMRRVVRQSSRTALAVLPRMPATGTATCGPRGHATVAAAKEIDVKSLVEPQAF
jgi:hypothetical protein